MRLLAARDARVQARGLADRLAIRLRVNGGTIALPGGTTPGPLFDALARRNANWRRVTVTMTDERWADPKSAASNEALLRRRLFVAQARAAHFVALKTPHSSPSAAAGAVSARLKPVLPLDICVLGMGEDGHIASLFPGADLASRGVAVPAYVAQARGAADRISLSLRAILSARLVVIFMRGREKRDALRRFLRDDAPLTPIKALLEKRRGPIWLSWSP
ncbi:MAG: 6-phosphogluconolactonase [Caulobacterales bacterium]